MGTSNGLVKRLVFLGLASSSLAACGGDDGGDARTGITLTTQGLEALTAGRYEGWLIFGEEKVSTGTFTDPAAAPRMHATGRSPADADKFALTIEPVPDADPGPSSAVVLVGDVGAAGTGADLAFPIDTGAASGGFILKTPSDDATNGTENDESGVWFVRIEAGAPVRGLTLPELPQGWAYEGWAVTQGVPLTTGRFRDAGAADLGSPYSDGGPPFPGEDFLTGLPASVTPPVDLADGQSMIVLSIEPDLGGSDPTGPGPFAVKPLATAVPAGLAGGTFTALGAGPVPTVSGRATFSPE